MRISSIIAAVFLCALAWLLVAAPCEKTRVTMREVTGTTVSEITWFGLFKQTAVNESPLAKWCEAHDIQVKEADRFYINHASSLLGQEMDIADGRRPAIALFRDDAQEIYVRFEQESAIKEFVAQMSAADDLTRAKLVKTAYNRMLALERAHSP
jgi:hypothetical protein